MEKNFDNGRAEADGGLAWYAIPSDPFDLYGIYFNADEGGFRRVPRAVAEATSEGVAYLALDTAGGRLRFSTDSDRLELRATYQALHRPTNMPLSGSAGFILTDETEGERMVCSLRPEWTDETGFSASTPLPKGGMRQYILYFPLYNHVQSLSLGLEKGARVGHGRAYADIPPVLYYGSSITQGGCASRPDNSYQALVSRRTNTDYINLGFSGCALAEKAMLGHLTAIDCSIFVCDYDHNAPDADYLRRTHRPFYEAYRAARPETPILLMSKPDIENDPQGEERRKIVRETYRYAAARGDKNVYYLDGKTLFGKRDRMQCTADRCHPNDLGFYRMAEAVERKLRSIPPFSTL